MKRYIALVLVLVMLSAASMAYADFKDIPSNASYADSVNRLASLGIMTEAAKDSFKPQDIVTREQFSVIMVRASALADTAEALKGTTAFSDVSPGSATSGYIAEAVSKGYISGLPDGKFHPKDKVTFAQVCTAAVRALGYGDQDVTGIWPKNYIEKASRLGLTDNISLKSNDGVLRWALALIVDRLLDTNVKKLSTAEADKSFADAFGLYTQCIIFENSITSGKLQDNQVMTDKGTFYMKNKETKLELGRTYRLDLDGDTIMAAYDSMKSVENISVESIVDSRISYRGGEDIKSKVLPEKTVYYYKGAKQNYDSLKTIIQTRSSIIFTMNKNKSGYDYAVIIDPVYSKPEIARGFDPASKRLGSIDLSGNPMVVRDGELSDILQIQEKDVVYRVSDIWNRYSHILALENRVGGKVTAILPDKLSPKTLQIDGKDYAFSDTIEFNKLNFTPGSFDVDDIIVAMLGHDGKIVDLDYPGSENNSDYALVLGTSSKVASNSNGTIAFTYYAKLLTADGLTITYDVGSDAAQYRGKLVKFKRVDNQKVTLEQFPYNFPKQLTVNKKDRYINSDYVSDNIRIFNIVSDEAGVDIQANLLDFKDLPEGDIADGRVYYMNKTGAFNDINVLLTNDILNQKYKTAVIKSMVVSKNPKGIYTYNYTLLIEGKEYMYSEAYINNGDIGTVVTVKMNSTGIDSVVDNKSRQPGITGTSVQGFDSKRIKINDKVLWFGKNISVYFLDYQGTLTPKSLGDLNVNEMYGTVSVYLDKAAQQGGRAEVIVVKK